MALTANRTHTFHGEQSGIREMPVLTNVRLFEGALVGLSAGYARPLVALDPLLGIALREANNNPGASGAINCKVLTQCTVEVSVVGATAVTDHDASVYASDDGTFTLTSTSNTLVGKVLKWISGTTCLVFLQGVARRSL